MMRVAAYQAPLLDAGSFEALALIRRRVEECEATGVAVMCCPEAVLGGLADDAIEPTKFAIPTARIGFMLAPLASDRVTTIIGFSELAAGGALYNSAAVLQGGAIAGLYRKHHPAIRRSVYQAGTQAPVFRVDGLAFGIVICYDSTFPELVTRLASQGATVVFVPSNNALPLSARSGDIVAESRACDIARATENRIWVVRADVAGRIGRFGAAGASAIVTPDGSVVSQAHTSSEQLLVADIEPAAPWTTHRHYS